MDPFVVVGAGALDDRTVGDLVALPTAVDRHLRTVLRREPGSRLVLSDGAGATAPAELRPDGARCLEAPTRTPAPSPALHVVQGMAKGRKVDEVVRTLTELGVDAITPVAAERSVKELEGDRRDKAVARWRAVAVAAAEQSRRPHVPVVEAPTTVTGLLDALADAAGSTRIVVAHVGATTPLSAALTADLRQAARLVLAVGPEGGWTPAEVAAFEARGAATVTLGPAVLRTEHAGVVLASVAGFVVGRMD